MKTLVKLLYSLVALGIIGFFVGSVIDVEFVYTLAACIAVWSGVFLVLQRRKSEPPASQK